MQASTRIILNTGASYGRSLFAIVAALFSTRWVLEALGQTDFGLFGVVGSLIVMVTFLNGGLQSGVSRFYAYAIGEGQNESREAATDRLKRWFNTAFSIHLVLPIILVLAGWPIGEYFIEQWLTIPDGRIEACLTVFRVSLLTAFMTVFSVPFVAMYSAHQRIVELSVFGILRSSAIFVLAWLLLSAPFDRLIVYGYAMTAINVGVALLQIARAMIHFPACRIRLDYMYNAVYFKNLFGFVGWKTFSMSCVTLRGQGTPMLINLQFGPLVNAAYQVAFSLSNHATALSQSLTAAFRPAVTSAEGKGDRKAMLSMALQACKFGAVLVTLFVVPLILEMENLLYLWLEKPPLYAVEICQWLLAMLVIDRLSTGQMLAVNARGKIAMYELVQGILLFSALPLMWSFFELGAGPVSVGVALNVTMVLYSIGRVLFAKYLLDFPVCVWLRVVVTPMLLILFLSFVCGAICVYTLPTGLFRLLFTSLACVCVTLFSSWVILLEHQEREFLLSSINKMGTKLCSRG